MKKEIEQTVDRKVNAVEESVLEKASITVGEVMAAVQIKMDVIIMGEVMKLKEEYAHVSAQLLEIDLLVDEMKEIKLSTKEIEGKIKKM